LTSTESLSEISGEGNKNPFPPFRSATDHILC